MRQPCSARPSAASANRPGATIMGPCLTLHAAIRLDLEWLHRLRERGVAPATQGPPHSGAANENIQGDSSLHRFPGLILSPCQRITSVSLSGTSRRRTGSDDLSRVSFYTVHSSPPRLLRSHCPHRSGRHDCPDQPWESPTGGAMRWSAAACGPARRTRLPTVRRGASLRARHRYKDAITEPAGV